MIDAPQVEVNCERTIDSKSEIVSRKVNIDKASWKGLDYLVEGHGAARAARVRHPTPAPTVLVARAAADHVHIHRQVIQLVPAALRRRADAANEELEGAQELAAVALVGLAREVDGAAVGDKVQRVFHQGEGVVREACAQSPTITAHLARDNQAKATGSVGVGVVWWARVGRGALTLLLEGLIVRLLQPRLLPHVIAAGLEECRKDDRAADGACVRDILSVRAVEATLVAAGFVDVGEEALVGVLVAERPLPRNDRSLARLFRRRRT